MDLHRYNIILASQSPRRKQLLQDAGFHFEVRPTDIPEDFPADMPPFEVAPFLAQKKAHAARHFIRQDELVLASDSVVILDGIIFNKPENPDEARNMLRRLSGNTHTVVTGVCLLSKDKEQVFSGVSQVSFDPLSEEEISFYLDTFQPYDKAGAYGIQEWIGLCKISRIEGTYSNVMGLPMDLVYKALQNF
jgi:septum formation protein